MKDSTIGKIRGSKQFIQPYVSCFIYRFGQCISRNPWYFILVFTVLSMTGIYPALVALKQTINDPALSSWSSWVAEDANASPNVAVKQLIMLHSNNSMSDNTFLEDVLDWQRHFDDLLAQNDFPCIQRDETACLTLDPIPEYMNTLENRVYNFSVTDVNTSALDMLSYETGSTNGSTANNDATVRAYVLTYFLLQEHVDTFDRLLHGCSLSSGTKLYTNVMDEAPSTIIAPVVGMMSPTSWSVILTIALFLFTYMHISLVRLHDIKAKFGLTVTVFIQGVTSCLTACSILYFFERSGPIYPFPLVYPVIVVMDMENTFRLIKNVISSVPTKSISIRITEGYLRSFFPTFLSLVSKLVTLLILSFFLHPMVQEYCLFLAAALTIDFILHNSFFLAVLSVDIRRLELQDLLNDCVSKVRFDCWDAWLGYCAEKLWFPWLSDNVGTISIYLGVISAQYIYTHKVYGSWQLKSPDPYFLLSLVGRIGRVLKDRHILPLVKTGWLGQPEIIDLLANGAGVEKGDLTLSMYRPLVGDRLPRTEFQSVYKSLYARRLWRWSTFFYTLLLVDFAVGLLVKILLHGSDDDDQEGLQSLLQDEVLSIYRLPTHHSLDVTRLSITANGAFLLSIGLDRKVVVWNLLQNELLVELDDYKLPEVIKAVALNSLGTYLVVFSVDRFYIYDTQLASIVAKGKFSTPNNVRLTAYWLDTEGNNDEAQRFVAIAGDGHVQSFVMTRDAEKLTLRSDADILIGSMVRKTVSINARVGQRFVSLSDDGVVFVASYVSSKWVFSKLEIQGQTKLAEEKVADICAIAGVDVILLVKDSGIQMVELTTRQEVHTFGISCVKEGTLHAAVSNLRVVKGEYRVSSVSLCFLHKKTGALQYYHYAHDDPEAYSILCYYARQSSLMDLHDPDGPNLEKRISIMQQTVREKFNCGSWAMTTDGLSVFGVRRKTAFSRRWQSSSLRRRRRYSIHRAAVDSYTSLKELATTKSPADNASPDEYWEVWMLSQSDDVSLTRKVPLQDQLLIANAGPSLQLTNHCVAVALGNVINIIGLGGNNFADLFLKSINQGNRVLRRRRRTNSLRNQTTL
ncbi:Sre1 cleavage activating protein Scp1 [Schizosaccharomyces japonicus yFS275]|uniref:Sterol regulatory element-binding protein cleavage-activating protein n=1 Tax=Schizosaccharomyces japonicus (strain yFS275 / FY16936) TaxID=402676 RepID=B6K5P2_SCHJY|nr:Sre1 cleavage activating protein Scp1 [Schizosaccharomyces japonicus yFS275]EEB08846.1 Sre1 cleavage activating protein Scp1 [Schizosaccharomyces japonicus yFS275]